MKITLRIALSSSIAGFACVVAAACANSNGAGSETHFVCVLSSDCDAGASCIAGRCVPSRADAGAPDTGGGGADAMGPVVTTDAGTAPGRR